MATMLEIDTQHRVKTYNDRDLWANDLMHLRKDHDLFLLNAYGGRLSAFLLSQTTGAIKELRWSGDLLNVPRPSDLGMGETIAAEQMLAEGFPESQWSAASYSTKRVKGKGVFTYPLGPVHADIAEALLYRLHVMGDEIIRLDLENGLKQRHIRQLASHRPISQALLIVERMTGTSAVAHALAYSMAVENALGIRVPAEVAMIRMILAELERAYSHLGDLAALAVSTGLSVPQMEYLHHKETILRLNYALFGHRYLRGVIVPGGVQMHGSTTSPDLTGAGQQVVEILDDVVRIQEGLNGTTSFLDRLHGAGQIPQPTIDFVRPVGPVGRGAGRAWDVRMVRPYLRYLQTDLAIPSSTAADSYSRFHVKAEELKQSLGILRRFLGGWPASSHHWVAEPLVQRPPNEGSEIVEGVGLVEAPRGLLAYAVVVNAASLTVDDVAIATPSSRNWYVVPPAMANKNILQDFPIIDASFNLSVAGWDG